MHKMNSPILVNQSIKLLLRLTCLLLMVLVLASCAGSALEPTPDPDGIFIDPSQNLGAISPYIYGINTGPWSSIPFERNQDALDLKIRFFRYPGGSWGDSNNLQKYQIDQYVDYSRKMGAEPSICVRVPGSSAEKAAELVRYTNIEKKYGVRYWCIGNEPSLYQTTDVGKDYDTAKYNTVWREFATAMRGVDPTILFLGPEVHQYTNNQAYNPKDTAGLDWMDEFLKANGDMVDIVSIHRYPFPRDRYITTTIDDLRTNPAEWEVIIPALRARIKELTSRDLPIAVTEINSHWSQAIGGEATPDSFYNAIWWADVLGRMIKEDVQIATYFMLPAGPGGFGLFARTDEIRPTYYAFMMYQHFGEQLVVAESGVADINAYASITSDGYLTVILINLTSTDQSVPLQVTGKWQLMETWLLDSSHNAAQVASGPFTNGSLYDIPAQSMTLLVFSPTK